MARVVLFLIVFLIVYAMMRGLFRGRVKRNEEGERRVKGEDMVACARCGVNMPKSEAREESGSWFCRDNPRCLAGP